MNRFLWMLGAMALGVSQANAAPKTYGLATVAYNDFETSTTSDSEFAYSLAFGKQIHRQWYAEAGYVSLFDYAKNENENKGDALYLALLGKASGGTGELFYKLGIAKVDMDLSSECSDAGVVTQCRASESIAAGIAGLGFDYYVGISSMIRLEYVHMTGEDSFSTNMVNVGFRYNFN